MSVQAPAGLTARLTNEQQQAVASRLEWASSQDLANRLWQEDHTLWKPDPTEISNRLGWLTEADQMLGHVEDLKAFADKAVEDGFTDALLLGMGGSSLASELMRSSFASAHGYLKLRVLDSTCPQVIAGFADSLPLETTLFLVSSKSGGTLETLSYYRFFRGKVDNGDNFVAITDPDSGLEQLGKQEGFRKVFLANPDIGGRYSALTHFHMVPAALMGLDIHAILQRAVAAEQASDSGAGVEGAPAIWLGLALGEFAGQGRDKLTLITPKPLDSFGLWAEQLVAESTGKEGKGIVPIAAEAVGPPEVYGDDRVFAYMANSSRPDDELEAKVAALAGAGHPVIEMPYGDNADLGALFFDWELAVAVAGAVIGINSFDQPNVQEAKDITNKKIEDYLAAGGFPEREPTATSGDLAIYGSGSGSFDEQLKGFLAAVGPGRFFATLAYIPLSLDADCALAGLRLKVRDATRAATTVGYGPRFQHSTGQLHKGGTNSGVFLQITCDYTAGLEVPDEQYDFAALITAQTLGDLDTLHKHDRRAISVHITGDPVAGIKQLTEKIGEALD